MRNQWFRLHAEFLNDPKVQMLSEVDQRRFLMILCMRCSSDKPDDFRDAAVMFALRITDESWRITKQALRDRYLIDENNFPVNWNKRQYISDIKDPTNAERQRRFRQRNGKKRYATVTSRLPDTDTDTDTDTDNAMVVLSASPKAKRQKPRTKISESQQPNDKDCQAAANAGLVGEQFKSQWRQFRDYHLSRGNMMADWSAAWRTWLGNLERFGARSAPAKQKISAITEAIMWMEDDDRQREAHQISDSSPVQQISLVVSNGERGSS